MESISNLKVPDLKRECKTRGLSTAGSKSDLVQRLTAAMAAEKQVDEAVIDDPDAIIDESILDEDEENGDDEILESPLALTSPSKTAKRPLEDSEVEDKKKITIKRQAVSVSEDIEETTTKNGEEKTLTVKLPIRQITSNVDEKLEKRKEKFGDVKGDDALKKRAERFGVSPTAPEGKVKLTSDEESKLNKRKLRFGEIADDSKLSKRAAKFGIEQITASVTASVPKPNNPFNVISDEKKKLRAARFGN